MVCNPSVGHVETSAAQRQSKRLTDWRKTKSFKDTVARLAKQLEVPIDGKYGSGALVEYERGDRNTVFLHPQLEAEYLRYISNCPYTVPSFVYVINAQSTDFYKIGITSDVQKRIRDLQTACPLELKVIVCVEVPDAAKVESAIHTENVCKKVRGEWFELSKKDLTSVRAIIRKASRSTASE